jgi:hypothetical protein
MGDPAAEWCWGVGPACRWSAAWLEFTPTIMKGAEGLWTSRVMGGWGKG